MLKKEEKDKHSVSSKHSSSHKEFYTKLAVIGVIITLVVIAFLFIGVKPSGKADYNYNPNTEEIGGQSSSKGVVYSEKSAVASVKNNDCPGNDCAENCKNNFCFSKAAMDNYDCFAPNTIVRVDDGNSGVRDKLCEEITNGETYDGYNWIVCAGDKLGELFDENDKFYCGKNKKFYPCITETNGEVNPNTEQKYLCVASSNKWVTCESNLDKKIQLDGLFLCWQKDNAWKWDQCGNNDKGKAVDTKKYYCENVVDKWKWKECTKNELSADGKQYCQQEGTPTTWKWKNCTTANLQVGDYICKSKGGVWTKVEKGDVVSGGELDTCNSTETGIHSGNSSKYCNGVNWIDCTVFNKFNLSTDGKAYCGSCQSNICKWSMCNSSLDKEMYPTGSVPNQYQYLCDGSATVQKWLTCDASTSPNLLFSSGASKDQFYCSNKGDHYQWQKCNSTSTNTAKLISGDNKYICKSGNKWTSPSKLGPDAQLKQFYGASAGGTWQTCNNGNGSKVIQESPTKYWQCDASASGNNTWKEKKCDKDHKDNTITDSLIKLSYTCEQTGPSSYQWNTYTYETSESINISATTDYEVRFDKTFSIKSVNNKFYTVKLCDTGLDPESATVCYNEDSKTGTAKQKVLQKGTPEQIKQGDSNLYFLYYGQLNGEKVVGVIYKVKPTATLDLSEGNIYYSQNVLVELEGHIYLLSYTQPGSSGNSITGNFFLGNSLTGAFTLNPNFFVVLSNLAPVVNNTINAYTTPVPSGTFDMSKLNLKLLKGTSSKTYTGTKLPSANCKVFENLELSNDMTFCLEGGALKLHPEALASSYQAEPTQVKLDETYENYISATQSLNILAPSNNDFSKIYLCDEESLGYKADICFKNEQTKVGVTSLKYLKGEKQGKLYNKSGVAFLYETEVDNPDAKQVKAILIKNIPDGITLEKDAFSENMRSGRRLVLKLYSQYYLLSHPVAGNYYDDKLVLQHLPTLNSYPNSGLVYLTTKGVQGVQFEPYAGEVITVYPDGNNYKISSKLSKEIATTYALPQDISNAYEVPFNKDAPVTLLVEGPNPIVSVCSSDNSLDAQKMLICLFNQPEITLTKNTPRNETVGYGEFTLLYQYLNNAKQGWVMLTQTLTSMPSELDYNNFMNRLAGEGKHLALKFNNILYLLQHSYPANIFEMTNLSLAYYKDQNKIDIPAVGNEKKVTFSLPDGGRISLERDQYEETPPPFKVWAQSKQEIGDTPVNLSTSLYTTFSSEGPVNVVQPNLGLVHVLETTDQKKVEKNFKIKLDFTNTPLTLTKNTPLVSNGVLFYYDQAYFVGAVPVKSARIYQLYNLSKSNNEHAFDNAFIDTFTAGNELALNFGSSYYLLGYQGASPDQLSMFDEGKIKLKDINNSKEYAPQPSEKGLEFPVAEGNIIVKFDYEQNKVFFSAVGKDALLTEEFTDTYTHTLTTTNKVTIGNSSVSMCSLNLYANVAGSAGICFNSTTNAIPIKNYQVFIIESKHYLLQVNTEKGVQKEITIHQILSLTTSGWNVNWEQFSQKLADGDAPVFDIGGTLYLPGTPDNQLQSLFFTDYADTKPIYAENIKEIGDSAILFNGTFVLKDRLLFASQSMTGEERDLTLMLRDYYIVPYKGAIELNKTSTNNFVTKIDGKKYNLYVEFNSNLVKLSLFSNSLQKQLINKYYKIGDTKYITLDGESIKIDITTKETVPGDKKTKIPIVLLSRS